MLTDLLGAPDLALAAERADFAKKASETFNGSTETALVPLAVHLGAPMPVVSADVRLASVEESGLTGKGEAPLPPILGSFTVDGLTYALVGERRVELVAASSLKVGRNHDGADVTASVSSRLSGGDEGLSARSVAEQPKQDDEAWSLEEEKAAVEVAFNSPAVLEEGVASASEKLIMPAVVECDGVDYLVVAVGPRAFASCEADAVALPATVEIVDELAFCDSLVQRIEVDSASTAYASFDGALYSADFACLLSIPGGRKGAVRIPSTTEEVASSAFSHCAGVDAISVDAGGEAFSSWDGLLYDASGMTLLRVPAGAAEVVVREGCTAVAAGALEGCSKLRIIHAPAAMQDVSARASSSALQASGASCLVGSALADGASELAPIVNGGAADGPASSQGAPAASLALMGDASRAVDLAAISVNVPEGADPTPWSRAGFSVVAEEVAAAPSQAEDDVRQKPLEDAVSAGPAGGVDGDAGELEDSSAVMGEGQKPSSARLLLAARAAEGLAAELGKAMAAQVDYSQPQYLPTVNGAGSAWWTFVDGRLSIYCSGGATIDALWPDGFDDTYWKAVQSSITSVYMSPEVKAFNMDDWFSQLWNLTDANTVFIPDGVTSAEYLFHESGIGTLPETFILPSGLKHAHGMFYQSNLRGLPQNFRLPEGIEQISSMFEETPIAMFPTDFSIPHGVLNMAYFAASCRELRELPEHFELPPTLQNADSAFYDCPNLWYIPGSVNLRYLYDSGCNLDYIFSRGGACLTEYPGDPHLLTPSGLDPADYWKQYHQRTLKQTGTGGTISTKDNAGSAWWAFNEGAKSLSIYSTRGAVLTSSPWTSKSDEVVSVWVSPEVRAESMSGWFEGFSSLRLLERFEIPNGVTSINFLFYGCSSLAALPEGFTVPEGVVNTDEAFEDTGLTSLPNSFRLPSTLESMDYMFLFSKLKALPEGFDIPDGVSSAIHSFNELTDLTQLPSSLNLTKLFSTGCRLDGAFGNASGATTYYKGDITRLAPAGEDPVAYWREQYDRNLVQVGHGGNLPTIENRGHAWWTLADGLLSIHCSGGAVIDNLWYTEDYTAWDNYWGPLRREVASVDMGLEVKAINMVDWFSATYVTSTDGIFVPEGTLNVNFLFKNANYGGSSFRVNEGFSLPASVVDAAWMWEGVPLESLPDSFLLHEGMRDFRGMFYRCEQLRALPASFTLPSTTTEALYLLRDCKSLSSLPDGFRIPSGVQNLEMMFANCQRLQTLPDGFAIPEGARWAVSMFEDSGLTALPPTFSLPSTLETSEGMFAWTKLSALPDGFRLPQGIVDISRMFEHCSMLTTLPEGFFIPGDRLMAMDAVFAECDMLRTLPASFDAPAGPLGSAGGPFYVDPLDPTGYTPTFYAGSSAAILSYDWKSQNRTLVPIGANGGMLPTVNDVGRAWWVFDPATKTLSIDSTTDAVIDELWRNDWDMAEGAGKDDPEFYNRDYWGHLRGQVEHVFMQPHVRAAKTSHWFRDMPALIDPSGTFVPGNATDVTCMFRGSGIAFVPSELSLPASVAYATSMFNKCSNLKEVRSGFSLGEGVTHLDKMLSECQSLEKLPDDFTIPRSAWQLTEMLALTNSLKSLPSGLTLEHGHPQMHVAAFLSGSGITSLPSGFRMHPTTVYADRLFAGCRLLESLPEGFVVPTTIPSVRLMFADCKALNYLPESLRLDTLPATITDFENMFYQGDAPYKHDLIGPWVPVFYKGDLSRLLPPGAAVDVDTYWKVNYGCELQGIAQHQVALLVHDALDPWGEYRTYGILTAEGGMVTLPDAQAMACYGYSFDGWFEDFHRSRPIAGATLAVAEPRVVYGAYTGPIISMDMPIGSGDVTLDLDLGAGSLKTSEQPIRVRSFVPEPTRLTAASTVGAGATQLFLNNSQDRVTVEVTADGASPSSFALKDGTAVIASMAAATGRGDGQASVLNGTLGLGMSALSVGDLAASAFSATPVKFSDIGQVVWTVSLV